MFKARAEQTIWLVRLHRLIKASNLIGPIALTVVRFWEIFRFESDKSSIPEILFVIDILYIWSQSPLTVAQIWHCIFKNCSASAKCCLTCNLDLFLASKISGMPTCTDAVLDDLAKAEAIHSGTSTFDPAARTEIGSQITTSVSNKLYFQKVILVTWSFPFNALRKSRQNYLKWFIFM